MYLGARPVLGAANKVIQHLFGTNKKSSEQHILNGDLEHRTPAGIARDVADRRLLTDYFTDKDVWGTADPALRNIETGDVAGTDVNVHVALDVGVTILDNMYGQVVSEYKHTKKAQCVTMADQARAIIYDGGEEIGKCEPAFAFQRYFLHAEAFDDLTPEVLAQHELSAYPLSMGATTDALLSPTKPQLSKAMRAMCKSPDAEDRHQLFGNRADYLNVWDMGSLLHRKTDWKEATTYGEVADVYVDHVSKRSGKHLVVFDRYDKGPQTKDNTHLKRSKEGLGRDLAFSADDANSVVEFGNTKIKHKLDKDRRSKFLSNPRTKQLLLALVQAKMDQVEHIDTFRGEAADADRDIANQAVQHCVAGIDVCVIGEDTDVLVLLAHFLHQAGTDATGRLFYTSEIRSKKTGEYTSWNVPYLCECLGDRILQVLLVVHAAGGCDTTSGMFNHGKGEVLALAVADDVFHECLSMFNLPVGDVVQEELAMAGRYIVGALYQKPNGKATFASVKAGTAVDADLDRMRLALLKKKDVHKGEVVDYRTIPCTADAADHHTLRVYYQVSDWAGKQGALDPECYGWIKKEHPLYATGEGNPMAFFPKWTTKGALPDASPRSSGAGARPRTAPTCSAGASEPSSRAATCARTARASLARTPRRPLQRRLPQLP